MSQIPSPPQSPRRAEISQAICPATVATRARSTVDVPSIEDEKYSGGDLGSMVCGSSRMTLILNGSQGFDGGAVEKASRVTTSETATESAERFN